MPLLFLFALLHLPAADAKPKRPKAAPAAAETAASATPGPDQAPPPVPRFARLPVPGCGCSVYAPEGYTFETPTKSEDGADVWMSQAVSGAWLMGAITVKFPAPVVDDADAASGEQLEALLIGYMEHLKTQLSITRTAGVGRGHTHPENPAARGVIDYWEDKDGDTWAVKGWVDSGHLAVMFIYGPGEYPYLPAQQLFLDGFRFE